jgi:hypothetical protein
VTPAEQLSETEGGVHVAVPAQASPASTVMSVGQPEKTGAVMSRTVTLNEHVATFPTLSLTVYVTKVVPNGKLSPGACVELTVVPHPAVAVGGVHVTTAEHAAVASIVILSGHLLMDGLAAFNTTTLNEQRATLPA